MTWMVNILKLCIENENDNKADKTQLQAGFDNWFGVLDNDFNNN